MKSCRRNRAAPYTPEALNLNLHWRFEAVDVGLENPEDVGDL